MSLVKRNAATTDGKLLPKTGKKLPDRPNGGGTLGRDRPILFSGPMVRALIEGRKTQTRRALKLQPIPFAIDDAGTLCDVSLLHVDRELWPRIWMGRDKAGVLTTQQVRFAVGQRLWVKETWAVGNIYDGMPPRDINPGGKPNWCGIRYAATNERLGIKDRSPLFMPRWASRLTLQVTKVRVERLNDIDNRDAEAEGVVAEREPNGGVLRHIASGDVRGLTVTRYRGAPDLPLHGMPRRAFQDLWERIHDVGSWKSNPWVAAITFTVQRSNIDLPPAPEELAAFDEEAHHG